jgi:hypothetical protein
MAERYLRESNLNRRLDQRAPAPMLVLEVTDDDAAPARPDAAVAAWLEARGNAAAEFRAGDRALLAPLTEAASPRCVALVQELMLSARVVATGSGAAAAAAAAPSLRVRLFGADDVAAARVARAHGAAGASCAAPDAAPGGALLAAVRFCAPRRAARLRAAAGAWLERSRWASALALRVLGSRAAARLFPRLPWRLQRPVVGALGRLDALQVRRPRPPPPTPVLSGHAASLTPC